LVFALLRQVEWFYETSMVKTNHQEEERKRLKEAMRVNPDAVVDLILELKRRIEELEARLKMNSRNSSKPPSSDGYSKPSPKSQRTKSDRKSGGQPGHPGNTLKRVETPDKIETIALQQCPHTGVELNKCDVVDTILRQVFDLPEQKLEVTEYRALVYQVAGSGAKIHGEFPPGVSAPQQYGFRFQAWLLYLVDYQLVPLRRVRRMCEDLFGYSVSEKTIASARERCEANLEAFTEMTKDTLKSEPIVHADETGIRVGTGNAWLHSLSTADRTLYHIDSKRGGEAIRRMGILTDFGGVLVHDFWQAYLSLECEHAICNAHIVRELTFFEDLGQDWAAQLKALLLQACEDPGSKLLQQWKELYRGLVKSGYASSPFVAPPRKKGQRGKAAQPKVLNLLDRLNQYESWILGFLDNPEIPFTNNQAEQDVRMAKVKQKISGCFRSWKGSKTFATIRSYISTCIKQRASIIDALEKAMRNKAETFT
jgi:transposase